jgi:hypothetical protein
MYLFNPMKVLGLRSKANPLYSARVVKITIQQIYLKNFDNSKNATYRNTGNIDVNSEVVGLTPGGSFLRDMRTYVQEKFTPC